MGRFSPGLGPPKVEAGVPMLDGTKLCGENDVWIGAGRIKGASPGVKPENPANG